MKNKNKRSYFIIIFISICLLCIFTFLFYRQAIAYNGKYSSDLPAHIRIALNGTGYSVIYFLLDVFNRIMNPEISAAILEGLFVVISWLLTGKLIQYRMQDESFLSSCLAALPLLFLSGIYIPYIYDSFYSSQMITQSWHNITYFGMRVFALCVLLVFVQVIDTYLYEFKFWQWLCLALFLALSTASKPNFLLGFALTLLLFLIADFIKYKFEKKPFTHMILMGTTVFPSLIILLFQAGILYGTSVEEGGSGIAVIWGSNLLSGGVLHFILRLFCNLAFPCLVYFMNRKHLDRFDKFTGLMFLVQYFIVVMFTETGQRAEHGNFSWGRMLAGYILFISALTMFWKDVKTLGKENRWYKIVGCILLAAHILSGLIYFAWIFTGRSYLV